MLVDGMSRSRKLSLEYGRKQVVIDRVSDASDIVLIDLPVEDVSVAGWQRNAF